MARPQGRRTGSVSGHGSVSRRGSGLGTGPIGSTGGFSGRRTSGGSISGGSSSFGSGSGGPRYSGGRRGGGCLAGIIVMIFIIIVIILMMRSCFNCASSGDISNLDYTGFGNGYTTNTSTGSSSSILNLFSNYDYTSYASDYSQAGSYAAGSNDYSYADTNVAAGSRDKYTTIVGDGNDTVTIMVYMCGTDLESKSGMASSDLREMCNATLSDNVNIIVYTGGCNRWQTAGISSQVNQIYKIQNGSLVCLEDNMGNLSMTSPSTLTEFIKYCTANYPADRQDLIFWDHGGGSISGFGYDEKAQNGSMTLDGINTALKNAGTKFDFIGFDACLMATVENGLMLSKYGDYMIASEETEPGVGWYYTNWLTALSSDTSMPTIEIGKNIVDDFINVCNQKCSGQKTTLSVVDLAELSATIPTELSEFSQATVELIQNDGYQTVSNARYNTKEFSKKIDQIDLVHFALLLNTNESRSLANALKSCVKYNRTAGCVDNAYGLSIYFPYQKASKVNQVVSTYSAIGMDSDYSKCITEFASLEAGGQMATGGSNSPYTSLMGGNYSSSTSSFGSISSLLGGLTNGTASADSYASGFDGSSLMSLFASSLLGSDRSAAYIANNYFDASNLVWTTSNGNYVLKLPEDQWNLVQDLNLNVFYDDGSGYIDLGLDNIFSYDANGDLLADYDNSWISINGQIVAYYHTETVGNSYMGYVPAFINGERAEIYITFNDAYPNGYITGAKYVYDDAENETSAKETFGLKSGDVIDFICDYYDYSGNYTDSYYLGDSMTLGDTIELGRMYLDAEYVNATFLITDIYNQYYWTPVIP
ncbi:MAG: clostripain-related cysteine peptidase [Lachnospiraceae bacterium]|nr:clostripain-related cysteine peptidase [Lachnospiraceae bacterium]